MHKVGYTALPPPPPPPRVNHVESCLLITLCEIGKLLNSEGDEVYSTTPTNEYHLLAVSFHSGVLLV